MDLANFARIYTKKRLLKQWGLVGLVAVRLISSSWNISFVLTCTCIKVDVHSCSAEYLEMSISSKIFLAESAETRAPFGMLSSIILRLCFSHKCLFLRTSRPVQDYLVYRVSPEPAFLCRLMWQSPWDNHALDRWLFFLLLPSLKLVWVGITELGLVSCSVRGTCVASPIPTVWVWKEQGS